MYISFKFYAMHLTVSRATMVLNISPVTKCVAMSTTMWSAIMDTGVAFTVVGAARVAYIS